ncbi:MAG: cysteine desulfurase [Lachnospiraceae bacterium]|nr:cysteine desulfurase [Lachnospiraceae bacterium]
MEVYFDNAATTRCADRAVEAMKTIYLEDYGNPSSMYHRGLVAENHVRESAEKIAKYIKVDPKEILFTSGGTESDNSAIIGAARANKRRGMHLITTAIEHPAILETFKFLEKEGYEVTYLPVDEKGVLRMEDVKAAIRKDTTVLSVMHTNNEIGSLQPLAEIGQYLKNLPERERPLFHTDAVQGFGHYKIQPSKLGIDMMSVSAHKIHGPKGVGFLYLKDKIKWEPYILGGGQQSGLRSGTQNVPGIVGMTVAVEEAYANMEANTEKMYLLKQQLSEGILALERTVLNGPAGRDGAAHVVSASFEGVRAEVLLHALEEKGIDVSAGSACASNKKQIGSDTMRAIGQREKYIESTLRFSLCGENTEEEVEYTLKALQELLPQLRKYTRY